LALKSLSQPSYYTSIKSFNRFSPKSNRSSALL